MPRSTPQNAASDQGLHFLQIVQPIFFRNIYIIEPKIPKIEINSSNIYFGGVITKTFLYNFDPLKPHFYIVKLGFKGVNIMFLISAQNIDCGYSLEPPRRGGSNE